MRSASKILSPEQIAAVEAMKACEVELVHLLQKYNCRLSMRDTVIDGKTVERMILPVPFGIEAMWIWEQFDAEKGRVEGMIVDATKGR